MQPNAIQPSAPVGSYIPKNDTATYHWFRKLLDEREQRDADGFTLYATDWNVSPHFARAVEDCGLVEGRKSAWKNCRGYRITELGRAAFEDFEAMARVPPLERDAFLQSRALERMMGEAA